MDSDGCITIKRRKQGQSVYYALFVIVGQSGSEAPSMLLRLRDIYGGSIDGGYLSSKPNRQPRHAWSVATAAAEQCLRLLRPHLVGKANQADIALAYRSTAMGRGNRALAHDFYERLQATKHYTRAGQSSS